MTGLKGASHLQIVYDDGVNRPGEAEVQAQIPLVLFGSWNLRPFGQDHWTNTDYINSTNGDISNDRRYKATDLARELQPGQTEEKVWELIGQVHDSLVSQTFSIDYDVNQNSNSYVNSVLSVVGINLNQIPESAYKATDMTRFPGIETNIIQDGVDNSPAPGVPNHKVHLDLAGTTGNDYIRAGIGNDTLKGGLLGSDTIFGGSGRDRIEGGFGRDALFGQSGNDVIFGGWSNDRIDGDTGNDYLSGDGNDDYVWGGEGNDTVLGGSGNDYIWGGTENDILLGGSGNDTLNGFDGVDRLEGGTGRDQLTGGEGRDTFVFKEGDIPTSSWDYITDFDSGWDRIEFNGSITRFDGAGISNGFDADTNRDGKISAADVGWSNWGSDGLIFAASNGGRLFLDLVGSQHELDVFDIV